MPPGHSRLFFHRFPIMTIVTIFLISWDLCLFHDSINNLWYYLPYFWQSQVVAYEWKVHHLKERSNNMFYWGKIIFLSSIYSMEFSKVYHCFTKVQSSLTMRFTFLITAWKKHAKVHWVRIEFHTETRDAKDNENHFFETWGSEWTPLLSKLLRQTRFDQVQS